YALTGCSTALWSLAAGWPLVFAGKLLGWFGKGVRGPLRNAILADAVSAADRGKAFGLHRAADTAGAVVGPLLAAALLAVLGPHFPAAPDWPFRCIFLVTLAPGLTATLAFALLVRENAPGAGQPHSLLAAWGRMPTAFRRYLVGVGVFGLGDFSRTFLILAATVLLRPWADTAGGVPACGSPAAWAAVLYAWHNACQAAASFPVGALSDRIGRRG